MHFLSSKEKCKHRITTTNLRYAMLRDSKEHSTITTIVHGHHTQYMLVLVTHYYYTARELLNSLLTTNTAATATHKVRQPVMSWSGHCLLGDSQIMGLKGWLLHQIWEARVVALNNSQYYRLTTGGTALSASILIKITAGFMSLLSIFWIKSQMEQRIGLSFRKLLQTENTNSTASFESRIQLLHVSWVKQ